MKKTVVITGSSDGIGLEAAKKLVALGYEVVIVGRNKEKTKSVAKMLKTKYYIADFSKLNDVKTLANELLKFKKIDVLVNNAGALMGKKEITEDGFEKTFQVNVLAQFLLTNLLIEKLKQWNTVVIQTSSIASNLFTSKFNIDDLNSEKKYNAIRAYGNSKLCNALFTKELNNRYGKLGINAVAFEPGVPRTNFAAGSYKIFEFMYHSLFKYLFTSNASKSSERMIRLVLGKPGKDFICGKTYSNKKEYKIRKNNDLLSKELWNKCEKYLNEYI